MLSLNSAVWLPLHCPWPSHLQTPHSSSSAVFATMFVGAMMLILQKHRHTLRALKRSRAHGSGLPPRMRHVTSEDRRKHLNITNAPVFPSLGTNLILQSFANSIREYAIVTLDRSGVILSWSETASRFTGQAESDCVGHFFWQVLLEARLAGEARGWLGDAERFGHIELDTTLCRSDGSCFYARVALSRLPNLLGDDAGYSLVISDLTARRITEQELLWAKEEAIAASEAKSQFLAYMSHEIRAPLSIILGLSELSGSEDCGTEEQAQYRSAIQRNGELLLSIINDVLDISKVEAGRIELESRAHRIDELLRDIEAFAAHRAKSKSLGFRIWHRTALPTQIAIDGLRFKQILINLTSNAIKFTSKGHVELVISYEDGHLAVRIIDTGEGLSPAQMAKLFAPFTQADASTSRRHGGSGLGLALSKRLAQAMGGDVWILHSAVGEGTTFEVRIPAAVIELELAPCDEKATSIAAPTRPLAGLRVLLVDDSPDNLLLVGRMLHHAGAFVESCDSGQAALQRTPDAYDLILMDIQMPGLDGFEVTDRLRRGGYVRPIFALTAHAFLDEALLIETKGFNGQMLKPVNRDQLIERLRPYCPEGRV